MRSRSLDVVIHDATVIGTRRLPAGVLAPVWTPGWPWPRAAPKRPVGERLCQSPEQRPAAGLLVVAQRQRHQGRHHPRPGGDEGQRLRRRADLRRRRGRAGRQRPGAARPDVLHARVARALQARPARGRPARPGDEPQHPERLEPRRADGQGRGRGQEARLVGGAWSAARRSSIRRCRSRSTRDGFYRDTARRGLSRPDGTRSRRSARSPTTPAASRTGTEGAVTARCISRRRTPRRCLQDAAGAARRGRHAVAGRARPDAKLGRGRHPALGRARRAAGRSSASAAPSATTPTSPPAATAGKATRWTCSTPARSSATGTRWSSR